MGTITLLQIALLLTTAGLVAPLAKYIKIGAVLGDLIAGVVIGPHLLGVFRNTGNVVHVAEFGVVLLLFIIGLELRPQRLWAMRRAVFGLGGTQVAVTAVVLTGGMMAAQFGWRQALFVGLALSLSSTAMVLQVLKETGEPAGAPWPALLCRPLVPGPRRHPHDRAGGPAGGRFGRNAGGEPCRGGAHHRCHHRRGARRPLSARQALQAGGPHRRQRGDDGAHPSGHRRDRDDHGGGRPVAGAGRLHRRHAAGRFGNTATTSRPISAPSRACFWGCSSSPSVCRSTWACWPASRA